MIYLPHLRAHVIRPVLKELTRRSNTPKLSSKSAENLIVGTVLAEALVGKDLYLVQHPRAYARGICQIEQPTLSWTLEALNKRYLPIYLAVMEFSANWWEPWEQLPGNLFLAVALCRGRYWLDKEPLPKADNIEGLGAYYKRVWATSAGKGTAEKFTEQYERLAM